jgi:hypothetical protein
MKAKRMMIDIITGGTPEILVLKIGEFLEQNPNVEIADVIYQTDEDWYSVMLVMDVGVKDWKHIA